MATNRELYFELKKLAPHKIDDSSIKLILLDINGFSSFSELIEHFDDEAKSIDRYNAIISQVKSGTPLQYVLGHASFLDLELDVDSNVLIPRPETEELVLFAVSMIKKECSAMDKITIIDIGTGTGAIAIALSKRISNSDIYASDISSDALKIARKNAEKYDVDVTFYEGDMLLPYIENSIRTDIIISNPPYIENESTIDSKVYQNEPHLALIAKPATKYYEQIFENVALVTKRKSWMFFEIGEDMEESLAILIKKYLPLADYEFHKDIYNKVRFLFVRNDTYENQ